MFQRIFILLTLLSGIFGAKNASLLYNGQDKVLLSLEKQFKVEILSGDKVKGTFQLPIANDSQITGTQNGENFGLKIAYAKPISSADGSLSAVELNFGITSNTKTG